MKQRRLFFAGTLAIILLAGLVVLGISTARKPQTVTLPGGVVLTYLDVTTAGNHSIKTGPNWEKLLNWMPSSIRHRFPRGTNEYDSGSNSAIGIWFTTNLKMGQVDFGISGENGIELRSTSQDSFDKGVIFVGFPSFQRASKKQEIGVLVPQENKKERTYQRAGEFRFDTPKDTSSKAAYTALTVPQTQTKEGLSATLTSLQIAPIRKAPEYDSKRLHFQTKADFEVTEDGKLSSRWKPCAITTSDLAGRDIRSGAFGTNPKDCSISFSPYPSPDSVWKLEVTFAKDSSFDPPELVTFENVRLPTGTEDVPIYETKRVNDCDLLLIKTSRGDVYADGRRAAKFHLQMTAGPINSKLSMVKCTTPAGDETKSGGRGYGGNPVIHHFEITNMPADTETVTVLFAVHRTHTFEFIAQPEIVDSLKP